MDGQLRGVAVGTIFALLVEVVLVFSTLALKSDALAWVHLIPGVLIYAMALTGMYFAQCVELVSAINGMKSGAQP